MAQNEVAVSLEDRPAVVAADSVRKLQRTDRAVEIHVTSTSAEGDRQPVRLIRTSVAASEEQYKTVIRFINPDAKAKSIAFFGTEGRGWKQLDYPDAEWDAVPVSRYRKPGPIFVPDAIERANGRVVRENATTLVVRINDSREANAAVQPLYGYFSPNAPGYLTIAIDKNHRRPKWAIRVHSLPLQDKTVHYHYQFSEYGETTVERPEGIPRISFWEVLGDVYYD